MSQRNPFTKQAVAAAYDAKRGREQRAARAVQLKTLDDTVGPYEGLDDYEVSYRFEGGEYFINIIDRADDGRFEAAYIIDAHGTLIER